MTTNFRGGAPLKYIPLCDVYSATSPCVTASGSKKVKAAARKPPQTNGHDQFRKRPITSETHFAIVYSRRRKRAESSNFLKGLLLEGLDVELDVDGRGTGVALSGGEWGVRPRRRPWNWELIVGCRENQMIPTSLSDDLDKTNCKMLGKVGMCVRLLIIPRRKNEKRFFGE
ncbi:uncharacterized protein LOC131010542 [Salvia miltiorrhiza]|uniref:uncharacterized protein LOC131010542 n=1 Tax=Salvia miltiorrhiza TaxID=226208 RepID=UPI0025AD2648|nr:uncharacterized protein LOC131010542 [Salvia miltiorrhiza]